MHIVFQWQGSFRYCSKQAAPEARGLMMDHHAGVVAYGKSDEKTVDGVNANKTNNRAPASHLSVGDYNSLSFDWHKLIFVAVL